MSLTAWLRQRFQPLSLGERGEKYAARYLRRLGYKILFTRHRQRYGEIDILAVEGQTVVFVEVKTRRSKEKGRPAEAVDTHRQARLTRVPRWPSSSLTACWNTLVGSTLLKSFGLKIKSVPQSGIFKTRSQRWVASSFSVESGKKPRDCNPLA